MEEHSIMMEEHSITRDDLPNQDEGTLNPKGVYSITREGRSITRGGNSITREEHSITRDDLPDQDRGPLNPNHEGGLLNHEGGVRIHEGGLARQGEEPLNHEGWPT